MVKRVIWIVLPLLLIASACGANLSGEPEVVFEQEVQALPTATPLSPQWVDTDPLKLATTPVSQAGTATPTATPTAEGSDDPSEARGEHER